jgi:hypothetical protein
MSAMRQPPQCGHVFPDQGLCRRESQWYLA